MFSINSTLARQASLAFASSSATPMPSAPTSVGATVTIPTSTTGWSSSTCRAAIKLDMTLWPPSTITERIPRDLSSVNSAGISSCPANATGRQLDLTYVLLELTILSTSNRDDNCACSLECITSSFIGVFIIRTEDPGPTTSASCVVSEKLARHWESQIRIQYDRTWRWEIGMVRYMACCSSSVSLNQVQRVYRGLDPLLS